MKKMLLVVALFAAHIVQAQTEVFSEDFQNGIPATWTIVDNDNYTVDNEVSEFDEAWISYTEDALNGDTVAASTSYFDPIDRADRWLITPKLTLSTYGNIVKWQAMSADPSFPDDYKVLISTTDSLISSFTDTLVLVVNEVPYFLDREVNLSENGFNDQEVFIAFVNTTFNGYKLFIDDVKLIVEDPLSTDTDEYIDVAVFPNPVVEKLNVSASKDVKCILYDMSGKEIKLEFRNNSADVSALTPGVYFLHLNIEGRTIVRKIVKN